jgi:hypothetical protein
MYKRYAQITAKLLVLMLPVAPTHLLYHLTTLWKSTRPLLTEAHGPLMPELHSICAAEALNSSLQKYVDGQWLLFVASCGGDLS